MMMAAKSPRRPLPHPRASHLAAISAALVIITFAAFIGVLSSSFVDYDDGEYVLENPHVQHGLTGGSIAWAFTTTACANWHPLTWLSHLLDVQVFGLRPGGHHFTNLLLHAANVVLLFLLLARMTGALWRPAFVAALFAIHPLHVESVAWIAERKDVLSTLLWLLTLAAWLWHLESKEAGTHGASKPAAGRAPQAGVSPYALVLILYGLGLMAKPMLVTLPFTLLLLDFWPLRRWSGRVRANSGHSLKDLLVEKAPLFAMSALSCIVTFAVQRSGGAVEKLEELTFAERLANTAMAYASYLGKTVWPASLAIFYPHPRVGLLTWAVAGSTALLATLTALALLCAKRAPYLVFGWFWFLGTLVPVIGLVQVGEQAMADRYTYMPLVGIFIAVAWGLNGLADGDVTARRAFTAIAALSLLPLFVATRIQVGYWAGSAPLFEHALAVTSGNFMAHETLGRLCYREGRTAEAIAHLEKALQISPDYAGAHLNLGNILAGQGRTKEAIEHYEQALKFAPRAAKAHNSLGVALVKEGRIPEAIEHYGEALSLSPEYAAAWNNLGIALIQLDRIPEAIEQYQQAIFLRPDYFDALNNLGLALARIGRLPEAIGRFRQALQVQPGSAEAHNNLGVALANSGRMSEAIDEFQQAVRIDPRYEEARTNLQRAQNGSNRPNDGE